MRRVGGALIETAGSKAPQDLTITDVRTACQALGTLARTTAYHRAGLMRRMLRDLREDNPEVPRLWQAVPKLKQAPPRDVTITNAERERLLTIAEPHMALLIHLCFDLAIRSGTATKLTPNHYDRRRRVLSFSTKYDARMNLPVTHAVEKLLEPCMLMGDPNTSFVNLLNPRGHSHPNNLRAAFRRLCKRVGITRRITLHDFRRTTAVNILDLTKDVRAVQAALGHSNLASTIHYLDHRLTKVTRNMLETASHTNQTGTIQ